MEDKIKTGRPPMYSTPEEMQKKIDEYFEKVPTFKRYYGEISVDVPCPTITGLTLFLGFCDRQSFRDYEVNKPEFTCTMKTARQRIENHYETLLQQGQPTGAIFALKNFGWTDKSEFEIRGGMKNDNHIQIEFIKAKSQDNSDNDASG